MSRVEKTVFISYRRTNLPWALAIYQNLTSRGYDVFFDYESINSGDFEQLILSNIRARAHFLVVLTPSALERCDDPNDWLRREIEAALDEKRNIVPVFLEGFDFNSPSISRYLTGKLENLKKYNGQNVPAGFFDEAMTKLRERFLNISLDAVLHPVSTSVKKVVQKQQVAANGANQVREQELTAQEWFEKGFKSTDPDEQIHDYTEAILLEPDFAIAYNNRGVAYENKGKLDVAMKDYSQAIKLKMADLHLPYRNRGEVLRKKGDLEGAIKDANEAIRLKPDHAEAYCNRGAAREDKGDLDGAIQDYTLAIKYKMPELFLPYRNRGGLRRAKGDLEGAIQDADEAIRLKPDYAEAYCNRGAARDDKGDLDGAMKDYTLAIKYKMPELFLPYRNRGEIRRKKGDLEGAIKDANKAIRLKPDHAEAYWNRGVVWWDKEEYALAAADFEKYFEVGGTDERVREYLNEVKKKIKK